MNALRRRVERLARKVPTPPSFVMTEETRREWCIKLGIGTDWLLLGTPQSGFVILPPKTDE